MEDTQIEQTPIEKFELVVSEISAPTEMRNNVITFLTDYFKKLTEWDGLINELVIEDENDTRKMEMARIGRLDLRDKRLEKQKIIQEKRDELKMKMADDLLLDKLYLRANQFLDDGFKHLESKLLEKEKYAENKIKAEKDQLELDRRKLLEPYQDYVNVMAYDLRNMPEDQFQITLKGVQHSYDEKQKQIAEEKEKNIRFEKRKNELQIAGISFDGAYYYVPEGDGKKIVIGLNRLKEIPDNEFDESLSNGKKLLQAHNERLEEIRLKAEKLEKEKHLMENRLQALMNVDPDFSSYNGKAFHYDLIEIINNELLLSLSDNDFNSILLDHLKRVEYRKDQARLKKEKQELGIIRYSELRDYLQDFREFTEEGLAELTDAKYKKLLKERKELHEERQREEDKQKYRRQAMFDLGLKWDGAQFAYKDINFHWTDLLAFDDAKFEKTLEGATKRMKQIKADELAEEEKRRKDLEAQKGTDKEKLLHNYHSWESFVHSELDLKSDNAQRIYAQFKNEFQILVSNYKSRIDKFDKL